MNLKHDFKIDTFISREERHYCAYLFSWLLGSRNNVETFLPATCPLGENYQLFYEYTAIREFLYTLKKTDKDAYLKEKELLNRQLINFEHPNEKLKNDIQKKKIDLAIQTQLNGNTTVYLIEAKFEEGFNMEQLELTENYGKILKDRFGVNYELILLGMEYHLQKNGLEKYEKISWESLKEKLAGSVVEKEIELGLEYQYKIHPKTELHLKTK